MASFFTKFLLCVLCVAVECRYFKLQNIPITPEGVTLRLVIKEDLGTGQPVAMFKIGMNEIKKNHAKSTPSIKDERTSTEAILPAMATVGNGEAGEKISPLTGDLVEGKLEAVPATVKEAKLASRKVEAVPLTVPEEMTNEDTKATEKVEEVVPLIPSFEDRFGIGDSKCPKGRIRKGRVCLPVGYA